MQSGKEGGATRTVTQHTTPLTVALCMASQIISSHRRVNHGKLSSADVCFLFAELSLWNVLLQVVSFELLEVSPGHLVLTRLQRLVVGVADNMKSRHSFVLVHWLVTEHSCSELVPLWEADRVEQ
ncbi:hypothetical protein HPB52_008361 [Rhipicephalus sanguineus]|uniref:Uncharacterized protein n=1 Tax=Rhipicephalus sanguineus TaxID=34632 RepID=A0A9D4QM19_RHISA|nr:hypothetical protein HPB52_008361 [Rhipicephalus sanguineus]